MLRWISSGNDSIWSTIFNWKKDGAWLDEYCILLFSFWKIHFCPYCHIHKYCEDHLLFHYWNSLSTLDVFDNKFLLDTKMMLALLKISLWKFFFKFIIITHMVTILIEIGVIIIHQCWPIWYKMNSRIIETILAMFANTIGTTRIWTAQKYYFATIAIIENTATFQNIIAVTSNEMS